MNSQSPESTTTTSSVSPITGMKSGTTSKVPKGFGKKYDSNLADDPTDEAAIKEHDRAQRFFAEMRKREF